MIDYETTFLYIHFPHTMQFTLVIVCDARFNENLKTCKCKLQRISIRWCVVIHTHTDRQTVEARPQDHLSYNHLLYNLLQPPRQPSAMRPQGVGWGEVRTQLPALSLLTMIEEGGHMMHVLLVDLYRAGWWTYLQRKFHRLQTRKTSRCPWET